MKLDVAVIGASSAGLYAAEQLARCGKRVAVFEQQTELAPARRTLIITPQLKHVLGYVPEAAVLHRIHTISVAAGAVSASVRLRDPDLIIERSLLAQMLAQRAEQAGVPIHYGHRFRRFDAHPQGVTLQLQTAAGDTPTVVASAVIAADGIGSDVARAAGLPHPPTVPIIQAEVCLPAGWNPDVTWVWFDTEETHFFYWLIPESATHGVVGLVGDEGIQTRVLLEQFLVRHGLQPLGYQGAQVAMYDRALRPWGSIGLAPILLVGDAAGQVKVSTVGGTVSGIWGADAAVRALTRGTTYAHELWSLRRELDLHWLVRRLLDRADNRQYERLVQHISPAVQRFLGHYNRDEMSGKLWTLVLRQPALLLLGGQLLFQRSSTRTPPPASRTPMPEMTETDH